MRLDRYGVLPILITCAVLIALGVSVMTWLVNNIWLVPTGRGEVFGEMQRAVVQGRANPNELIAASDYGLIVIFVIAVGIVGFGIGLPFVYFLNRRVRMARNSDEAATRVLLRQGFWVGLWFAICVLLQMYRIFNPLIGLMVALTFGLVEMLLVIHRRSGEVVGGEQ